MGTQSHWRDWVATVVGVWIMFSPLTIPFLFGQGDAASIAVTLNHFVVGAVVAGLGWVALSALKDWEEYVGAALGLWLAASPWVLGFLAEPALTWNAMIAGMVVVIVSVWALYARTSLMRAG